MSQSPLTSDGLEQEANYLDGWNSLSELLRTGHSFSGRERNCAFLNLGDVAAKDAAFADVSSALGLDLMDDGRGMAIVDWDQDGDVDLWMANRTGPRARLMLNETCPGSGYVAFELRGTQCNRDAISARVELVTTDGAVQVKTVRAGDGFLSQSSKKLHFGLPSESRLREVRVRWPGSKSLETFSGVAANGCYLLVEGDSIAELLPARLGVSLSEEPLPVRSKPSLNSRVVLAQRHDWPDAETVLVRGRPGERLKLVCLWASWCKPCLAELDEMKQNFAALSLVGVDVVAVNLDAKRGDADAAISSMDLPFAVTFALPELLQSLALLDQEIFYRKHPLSLPQSYLLDTEGKIAIVYKGRVTPTQVVNDAKLLGRSTVDLVDSGLPFAGRRVAKWFSPGRVNVARAYFEGGYIQDAKRELLEELNQPTSQAEQERALRLKSEIAASENDLESQLDALNRLQQLRPGDLRVQLQQIFVRSSGSNQVDLVTRLEELASSRADQPSDLLMIAQAFGRVGDPARAIPLIESVVAADPKNAEALMSLGIARQITGEKDAAITAYRKVVVVDSERTDAMNNLAWLLLDSDPQQAVGWARKSCQLTDYRHPSYLDTLTLALAQNGDTEQAIQVLRKAIPIARGRGEQKLTQAMVERLADLLR